MQRNPRPSWIFSTSITEHWNCVPTEVLHPWQVPLKLKHYGVLLRQCGPEQNLLPAALKRCIFLTRDQLEYMQQTIGFPMKAKGQGSGVKGGIVKRDYAQALIQHFYNDENSTEAERLQMLKGLLGQGWRQVAKKPKVAEHMSDILAAAFKSLNPEDQREFSKMSLLAKDEQLLYRKYESEDRAPRSGGPVGKREHVTPTALSLLLPKIAGCSISRHPKLKRYQCWYSVTNEKGTLDFEFIPCTFFIGGAKNYLCF